LNQGIAVMLQGVHTPIPLLAMNHRCMVSAATPFSTCCGVKRSRDIPMMESSLYFSQSFKNPAPLVCRPCWNTEPSISTANGLTLLAKK
jgi:hypothetical protein